jgi:hypothetical protein
MSLIQLPDFNNLQASIATILGKGSGTYGYGQDVTSSHLGLHATVTAKAWTKMRNDLLSCFLYQNGGNTTNINAILPPVASSNLITPAVLLAYRAVANTITVNCNPATIPIVPYNQGYRNQLTSSSYSSWNNLVSEVVTISFLEGLRSSGAVNYNYTADDAARFYFNSGSVIEFDVSLTGATGTLKDQSWIALFNAMGTIRFGLNTTYNTGGATPGTILTTIGFTDLTTTDQTIFTQFAEAGTYSANYYKILARKTGSPGEIVFTVICDDATGLVSLLDDGVTGNTTCTVKAWHANGYVSLPSPLSSTTSVVSYSPNYVLNANYPARVEQGSPQIFYILTTNVLPGTTVFWTTNVSASKFLNNVVQGTAVITDNAGSFTIYTNIDYSLTSTVYTVSLHTGSYNGPLVAATTATINELIPTYAIFPDKTTLTENNDSVILSVYATGIPPSTLVRWQINSSNVNAADGTSLSANPISFVNGLATITLTTIADYVTEGTESFTVSILSTVDNSILVTSELIYILDTTFISASLTPNKSLVRIGEIVTFKVNVTGFANNANLYWKISGEAADLRFDPPTVYGTVAISGSFSAGIGNIPITIAVDTDYHAAQVFYMQLYSDAALTSVLGGPSTNVTIGLSGTLYYGASGSITVPAGVKQLIVNGVGGGGASTGFHKNSGTGTGVDPGGPGGGILNYTTTVNTGDVCAVTVGSGGGPGCYAKGGWCSGSGGTPTVFYINGVQCFSANPGIVGGSGSPGAPGNGVINVLGSAGSVVIGTAGWGVGFTGTDVGYSVWDYGGVSDKAGIPPIPCPIQVLGPPIPDERGRAERAGWLSITYS